MSDAIIPGGTQPAADSSAAPVVPVEPAAPVIAAVPETAPTAEEAAAIADAAEWGDAANEIFPGITKLKKEEEDKKDEQADSTTTTTTTIAPESETTTTTTTIDPGETAEQKAEREVAAAKAVEKEAKEPDTAARDTRLAARESQRQVETVAVDVRKKMFADAPTELLDSAGDPIKTIEDVMQLINPQTGEAFTQEEAGMWFLSAQQNFNKQLADQDKEIERIAEVNVDLKDQADVVTFKYGELLKADTALRDRVWAQYEKTLIKDPKTDVVTGMPVSLEEFYEVALAPYVKLAETVKPEKTAEEIAAEAKVEADKKVKARADRSDIFGGGKDGDADDEDKEWSAAATAVFGPLNPKK